MARAILTAVASPSPIVANVPLVSIGLLAVAVLFEISGALMLALGAPPLASLHAFAAFIVLAVVAASQQLLPVLFASPPTPLALTVAVSAGFVVGFSLLIGGFFGLATFGWAVVVLVPAAALWVAAMFYGIVRAAAERLTAAMTGVATVAFLVAVVCGGFMATSFARGSSFPNSIARIHGSLMLLVFVATFIIALSYRFVPMFALSHSASYGRRPWQYVVLFAGIGTVAGLDVHVAFGIGAAGLIAIGVQHLRTIRARVRRQLDVSLVYAGVGWCFAIVATTMLAIDGESPRLVPAVVVLALLGWITLTIFGYGMKIAGFLSWQFARNRDQQRKLAPLSAAVPPILNRITLVTLTLGAVGSALAAAVLPALAEPCAYLFLFGSLLYGVLIVQICTPYIAGTQPS